MNLDIWSRLSTSCEVYGSTRGRGDIFVLHTASVFILGTPPPILFWGIKVDVAYSWSLNSFQWWDEEYVEPYIHMLNGCHPVLWHNKAYTDIYVIHLRIYLCLRPVIYYLTLQAGERRGSEIKWLDQPCFLYFVSSLNIS